MDRQQALQRLISDLGNDSDPDVSLTDAELQRLLDESTVPDPLGLPPADPAWTPTWDLNRAASEGWRLKASRLATTGTTVSMTGERGPDDYRYLNAVRQAEYYAARRRPPRLS